MHITIVNAHWNNRGDEASLVSLLYILKKNYTHCKFTILFKDRKEIKSTEILGDVEYTHAQFKTTLIELIIALITRAKILFNQKLKKTILTILDSDLIVYAPGGSVINDRFYWSKQLEYLTPFACSRYYSIPLIIMCPSIGPLYESPWSPIRKYLLKAARFTAIREDFSRKYLEDANIKSNIHTLIDLTFATNIDYSSAKEKINSEKELMIFLSKYKKIIGITITDFKWHVNYRKDKLLASNIKDTFIKFISYLRQTGYGILLIPQLFGNQNDREYLNSFVAKDIFILSDHLNSNVQQYLIENLHSVIGMRYHSNIFAAKVGTPFIAINYEEKTNGFLDIIDWKEMSIPLNELSTRTLLSKFNKLEKNYSEYKYKLKINKSNFKHLANQSISLLKKYGNFYD